MKQYCYNCMEELDASGVCKNCGCPNDYIGEPHHLIAGTTLNNKYIVGRALGEGGFGITYIGRDPMLDIKVAIKEFYPSGHVNRNNSVSQEITTTQKQKEFFEKGKKRFLQEARSIAKFNHEKGIVDIHDYFEENGTAYIMMEYLDGETLSECIKKHETLNSKRLFELLIPLMESLKKIHDAGIIHRDISPDNIMYLKDGTLKLMDFGSARYFQNQANTLSVVLKMGFAPLEQYNKNGEQGPWTDVYGLCATIYKCITGKTPDEAIDRLTVDNLKPPSQLGIKINPQLEKILMQGLALNHNDRIKNMDTLITLTKKALNNSEETQQKVLQKEDLKKRVIPQKDDGFKTQYADVPVETDDKKVTPSSGVNNKVTKPKKNKKRAKKSSPEKPDNSDVLINKPKKRKTPLFIALGVVLAVVISGLIILDSLMCKVDGCYNFECSNEFSDNCLEHSVVCPKCSTYLNEGASFCPNCDISLPVCKESGCNEFVPEKYDTAYCSKHSGKCINCNAYINPDLAYCVDCLNKMCTVNNCTNISVENMSYCENHCATCNKCRAYINPYNLLCSDCIPKTICYTYGCNNLVSTSGRSYYCPSHSGVCKMCLLYINQGETLCGECALN